MQCILAHYGTILQGVYIQDFLFLYIYRVYYFNELAFFFLPLQIYITDHGAQQVCKTIKAYWHVLFLGPI